MGASRGAPSTEQAYMAAGPAQVTQYSAALAGLPASKIPVSMTALSPTPETLNTFTDTTNTHPGCYLKSLV